MIRIAKQVVLLGILSTNIMLFENCSSGFKVVTESSDQLSSSVPAIPTINLSLSSSSLILGASASLTWSTLNATACSITSTAGDWSGNLNFNGTQSVSPTTTDTYSITCTNSVGKASQSITLTVVQPAPSITISASPSTIKVGGTSTLTWSSTNATTCTASGAWTGTLATSGSSVQTPQVAGTSIYSISCTGPGGTASQSTTLTVSNLAAPVVSLSASPSTIVSGATSTLTWNAPNAVTCTASGVWSGAKANSGTLTVTPTATSTYTLTCTDAGGSATQSVMITVTPHLPNITISANPTSIMMGGTSTLTWSSTNTTTCAASGAWLGNQAISGSVVVTPNTTSVYTLTCSDGNGNSVPQSVTVNVTSVAIPSVTLSANPSSVVSGGTSTLTWSSTNATSCTASGGWSGTQATSGTYTTGALTAASTYKLTCTGLGGTSAPASQTVAINSPTTGDPLPSNRRTDWTHAGVPGGIPHRTTICATFSPGAKASAINSAISSCNNGVVFLNPGTYSSASLGGTIQLYQSNVTLRGSGADQTTLTGLDIINVGNGYNVSLGTAITGGATQGSFTFTAASSTNLSVGTMIEVDRDDDTALVVNTGNQAGGTRNVTQINMITAISGNTVTVRNPFFYDFSKGNPKVKFYYGGITQKSGVEDLKLDHTGFSGGYNSSNQYCDSCWLKGIESGHATGYHFIFLGSLNVEIRDSYIHEGSTGPNNSGINFYGNYLYGANSNAKIENVVFNKNFPAVELNGSSSGFYIGYNFSYGSYDGTISTWTFDDGHAPFNIMNLYEGNIAEMMGADNYFGGTGYGTVLRNYFRGQSLYGPTSEAIWLDRLAYNYNLVGNVLGSSGQAPSAYLGCSTPGIFRLGMPNLGNCDTTPWDGFSPAGGYPDAKVASTLLRWGNYDYFNKTTRFIASEIPSGVTTPTSQVLPQSYVYSEAPAWWPKTITWPPIGPDISGGNGDTAGHVNKIPAQTCWEASNLLNGGSFNAKTCYPNSI